LTWRFSFFTHFAEGWQLSCQWVLDVDLHSYGSFVSIFLMDNVIAMFWGITQTPPIEKFLVQFSNINLLSQTPPIVKFLVQFSTIDLLWGMQSIFWI
jgi:hypothetical protein